MTTGGIIVIIFVGLIAGLALLGRYMVNRRGNTYYQEL